MQTFHIDLDEAFPVVVETMKRLIPDHKPIWTCVQIGKLGMDGEIEVGASCGVLGRLEVGGKRVVAGERC